MCRAPYHTTSLVGYGAFASGRSDQGVIELACNKGLCLLIEFGRRELVAY